MGRVQVECQGCQDRIPAEDLTSVPQGHACPGCGAVCLVNPGGRWDRPIPAVKWAKVEEYLARHAYSMASSYIAQEAKCSLVSADEALIPRIAKHQREKGDLEPAREARLHKLEGALEKDRYQPIVSWASEHENDPIDDVAFDRVVATALECLGQRRRALVYYRNAYLRNPRDPQIIVPLAELLIRMGYTSQAKRYILELRRIAPDDPRLPVLTDMLNDRIARDQEAFGEEDEEDRETIDGPEELEESGIQLEMAADWHEDLKSDVALKKTSGGTAEEDEEDETPPRGQPYNPDPALDDSNIELEIPDDL